MKSLISIALVSIASLSTVALANHHENCEVVNRKQVRLAFAKATLESTHVVDPTHNDLYILASPRRFSLVLLKECDHVAEVHTPQCKRHGEGNEGSTPPRAGTVKGQG